MMVIVEDCTQDDPEELSYINIGWECEVIVEVDDVAYLLKDLIGNMFYALKRDCKTRNKIKE